MFIKLNTQLSNINTCVRSPEPSVAGYRANKLTGSQGVRKKSETRGKCIRFDHVLVRKL